MASIRASETPEQTLNRQELNKSFWNTWANVEQAKTKQSTHGEHQRFWNTFVKSYNENKLIEIMRQASEVGVCQ